jgi:hypothetical protein
MIGITLLSAGAPERRKLDHLRGQIRALVESLQEIRDASLPVTESVQRFMATIEPDIERARQALLAVGRPDGGDALPPVDALVAAALLQPVEFEKRVAAILAAAPGKPGLSAGERRKKIAECEAKIAALEIAEETEIIRLEVLNCCVERRPEVPISRLFEVWDAA